MIKYVRFFLVPVIIIFFVCCKRDHLNNGGQAISIQVVEYKTDSPIENAVIEYFEPCTPCNYPGGLAFVAQTPSDGRITVPDSIFNNKAYGVVVYAPSLPLGNPIYREYSYQDVGSDKIHLSSTKYELPVIGGESLHLIKTNTFPPGYSLEIDVVGEKPSFAMTISPKGSVYSSDTTITFTTYRNQTNTYTWKIYDLTQKVVSTGGPMQIFYPKSGYIELDIKY
jgi:hypothetical protein